MSVPYNKKDPIPSYPYNYKGIVMDDVDPLNAGRVRVKVYPMFKDLDTDVIPWSRPATPILSGAGVGYGEYLTPEVGSWVWVFFEAGDIQQPVYFASAPSATVGLPSSRAARKKVLRTKGGVEISINDVTSEIRVSQPGTGASVVIAANGSVSITSASLPAFGVVTQECICAYTGAPHPDSSTNIKASR